MATIAIVPVEEYLRTAYEPDREYVAGQLVERNVGEIRHSRMQALMTMALGPRERERSFTILTGQRVRVSEEPRHRIPDLCVKARPFEMTPVITRPDLAIEIVSPDDSPSDLLTKIAEYLAAGIPHIWIVDPYQRAVFEADRGGLRRSLSGTLETDLVGAVDFGGLFEELDQSGVK